jgi:Dolichyl-phosphate-mannose-protein mannosyltransferase
MGTDSKISPLTLLVKLRGRFSAWSWLTLLAGLTGLALLAHQSLVNSATYDEVAYLRVATHWWRTGDQSEITRMGSPLTFWKLQQVPVLWLLDHSGRRDWINDPAIHQQALLPLVRLGSAWIWLVAFGFTAAWARRSNGPRAMALAAWLFTLSPNLLAHGALITMELPLVAAVTVMFFLFRRFLETSHWRWFWAAAAIGGVGFSCKFTMILFPAVLGVIWWVTRIREGEPHLLALTRRIAYSITGFLLVMLLADVVVTGFARLPLSSSEGNHPTVARWFGQRHAGLIGSLYETPVPQDWVGFLTQLHHQASGGPSYLLGERRMKGWWYYYLVALAVKVPPAFWLLVAARIMLQRRCTSGFPPHQPDMLLPLVIALYLGATAVGSSRNYGFRYLLPLAPLAIIWVSAVVVQPPARARGIRILSSVAVLVGLAGYLGALVGIHPHELSYFNGLAGGPLGGRRILADSNLDWGQGLKSLARLQQHQPELADMTLYYFGDTRPSYYGVQGVSYTINAVDDSTCLPAPDSLKTRFIAVSASLAWGPWGPPAFFESLKPLNPVLLTDDTTIAIYRSADLQQAR